METPDIQSVGGRELPTNVNLSFPLVRRRKLQSLGNALRACLKGILTGQTRRH